MTNTLFVRLRRRDNGPQSRMVYGKIYKVGQWHPLEDRPVAGMMLSEYLRTMRLSEKEDSPRIFDVCTEEEGLAIENGEWEVYHRSQVAAALPTPVSQIARAAAQIRAKVEGEAAQEAKAETSQQAPEEPKTPVAETVDVPMTSRRAQRLSRTKQPEPDKAG